MVPRPLSPPGPDAGWFFHLVFLGSRGDRFNRLSGSTPVLWQQGPLGIVSSRAFLILIPLDQFFVAFYKAVLASGSIESPHVIFFFFCFVFLRASVWGPGFDLPSPVPLSKDDFRTPIFCPPPRDGPPLFCCHTFRLCCNAVIRL